jgi:hypothetical protein
MRSLRPSWRKGGFGEPPPKIDTQVVLLLLTPLPASAETYRMLVNHGLGWTRAGKFATLKECEQEAAVYAAKHAVRAGSGPVSGIFCDSRSDQRSKRSSDRRNQREKRSSSTRNLASNWTPETARGVHWRKSSSKHRAARSVVDPRHADER